MGQVDFLEFGRVVKKVVMDQKAIS